MDNQQRRALQNTFNFTVTVINPRCFGINLTCNFVPVLGSWEKARVMHLVQNEAVRQLKNNECYIFGIA